jgi:cytochrome b6-f complex iron-sulfur subunit
MAGLAFAFGSAALTAGVALWTAAIARFLAPNATKEIDSTFKAGFPSEYSVGKVETKFKDRYQAWIVAIEHDGRRRIVALRTVCTHLGCITLWNEGENRFKCPCHGSGYSLEGENLEGPAPRPLDRYAVRLAEDGLLEIDRTKIFPHDPRRTEAPESFVEIG